MAKDDDKKPTKGRKRTSAYKLDESTKKEKEKPEPDAGQATEDSAAPDEAAVDDNVVDLDEAREAAAEEPGLLDGLGSHVRKTVREYLVDNVVPEGQTSGNMNINVDAAFLKEHGPKLIGSIAQSLFKAVVPNKLEMSVPLKDESAAEEAEKPTEDDGGGDANMSVNLDLGNFFKSLFAGPKTEVEKAEGTEAEKKDED